MEKIFEFRLTGAGQGRAISDFGWETMGPDDIRTWREAQRVLGRREIVTASGSIRITFDFSEIISGLEHNHCVMKDLELRRQAEATPTIGEFYQQPVTIPITVQGEFGEEERLAEYQAESCAVSALHDIFLVMNLAAPGSCDFYSSMLDLGSRKRAAVLGLLNGPFESAYLASFEGGWPRLQVLDLQQVAQWYWRVRSGFAQTPGNRAEKALFGLLHLAKIDVSPVSVIWVFYALETLFDSKAGENFRMIRDRISILLATQPRDAASLRRNLRELYDLRSAIVHGGLEVTHPMIDDGLDRRVGRAVGRYLDATNFGAAIVVAALQEIVKRGWAYPRFTELVEDGQPL
ncbi:MAG TPA: hypothetical protein VD846_10550 [Allosphingosinicella sp.]|nr:hypothetical protein [Allosphingosinicella sp.]